MAPHHPYRRLSDHLILVADALLLTVLAGAGLIVIKNLAMIPASSIDPMDAFLITMTLAAMLGAGASWFAHRRSVGLRGLWMLAVGLVVAAPALVGAHALVTGASALSPRSETVTLVAAQILGLAVLLPPLVAGLADLFQRKHRRFEPVAIARLAGLFAMVAMITLRFLPETQVYPVAAHLNAMLGLSTIAGGLAVGIGDAILLYSGRRAARRIDAPREPAETA
jgi:hypothetical protein